MQRKPPLCSSWVELYDKIAYENPSLLEAKSFMITIPEFKDNEVRSKTIKIYTHTLMKNSWQEIQQYRINFQDTMQTLYTIEMKYGGDGQPCVANKLLKRLMINNNGQECETF